MLLSHLSADICTVLYFFSIKPFPHSLFLERKNPISTQKIKKYTRVLESFLTLTEKVFTTIFVYYCIPEIGIAYLVHCNQERNISHSVIETSRTCFSSYKLAVSAFAELQLLEQMLYFIFVRISAEIIFKITGASLHIFDGTKKNGSVDPNI